MPGHHSPPNLPDAVQADEGSASSFPSAEPCAPLYSTCVPDGEGETSLPLPQRPRDQGQSLRQFQDAATSSEFDLIEGHQRRERELQARLEQARQVIEAGRLELAHVKKLLNEQGAAMLLQQQQHQTRLRELQASLSAAHQASERSQRDLEGLRQRCAQLEQDCEHGKDRIEDLVLALQTARDQLGSQGAALQAMQRRSETQEREESERQRASHQQELDRQQPVSQPSVVPGVGMASADPETERLRQELSALHHLLEELPEIYERKFRQRLLPLLEQRDWLLHENGWLRAELLPAPREPERPALPQASRRRGLLESMQALLSLRLPGRRLPGSVSPAVDQHPGDDGPPRAA